MKKEFSTFSVKGYDNLARVTRSWLESGKNILVYNVHRENLSEDFLVEVEWLV